MERFAQVLLALVGCLAIAGPAAADPVFPIGLTVDKVANVDKETMIWSDSQLDSDDLNKEKTHTSDDPHPGFLKVFEGGKLLAWSIWQEFSNGCASDIAIIYVPSGAKSGAINCDDLTPGLGGTARRTLAGSYQSTTSISGNTIELTGVFNGRYRFFERPSDPMPIYDGTGSLRQHAKFQITQAGCQLLAYESEMNVRENYANLDMNTHSITNKSSMDRLTPASECHVKR